MARLSWEKGKLRSAAGRAGATHVAAVFEKRRKERKWWSRLSIPAARLHLVNDG
jgi:hypothetical protein